MNNHNKILIKTLKKIASGTENELPPFRNMSTNKMSEMAKIALQNYSEKTLTLDQLSVGMKVHYQPDHYKENDYYENGIIKEIPNFASDPNSSVGNNSVRVVYNCNSDWKHYNNYTSALTNIYDLKIGWR